jgi:hypothetical protein
VARDQETEQEQLLDQLRAEYPLFEQFIDKLLVTTGVLQRQDGEVPLEEWLQCHVVDRQQLLLVPLPSKRPPRQESLKDESSEGESSSSDEDSSSEEDSSESGLVSESDDDSSSAVAED